MGVKERRAASAASVAGDGAWSEPQSSAVSLSTPGALSTAFLSSCGGNGVRGSALRPGRMMAAGTRSGILDRRELGAYPKFPRDQTLNKQSPREHVASADDHLDLLHMNGNGPTAAKRPRVDSAARPATPAASTSTPTAPYTPSSTAKSYASNAASNMPIPTTTTPPAWTTAAQSKLCRVFVAWSTPLQLLFRSHNTRPCARVYTGDAVPDCHWVCAAALACLTVAQICDCKQCSNHA